MTVINPSSISGITSITMPSGDGNVLTIHTNDGTERFRIDSSGNVKVGSACTISQDGDVFFTGVCTATTLTGAASGLTGALPAISGANLTNLPAANLTGALPAISGANLTGIAATDNVRTGILDVAGISTFRNTMNVGAAVTISESGIEATGVGITVANINGGQIGGRRNIIINGDMRVAQRGTSSNSVGYQTCDRWYFAYGGENEAPGQDQVNLSSSDTPYSFGFRKSYKITNGNQTSTDAADYLVFYTVLEAQNLATSGWNYTSTSSFITLSFWSKSSVAKTFDVKLTTNDGTAQQFNHKFALSANTWTKVEILIPGNSNLTFNNDNGKGVEIQWDMYSGTNYTSGSTVDQWVTYNGNTSAPDQTADWWTTNNATFELTGVQLEVGQVATAFEHRTFAEEELLCKRYFQSHAPSASDHMMWGVGRAEANTGRIMLPIQVPMRTAPTVATTAHRLMRYDGTGSDSTSTPTVYNTSSWISRANVYTIDFPGHSSLSHNNTYMLTSGSGTGLTLDADM